MVQVKLENLATKPQVWLVTKLKNVAMSLPPPEQHPKQLTDPHENGEPLSCDQSVKSQTLQVDI
ncbi:Uncharacterised protein [Acinetobacter baumannii]|nr:Uncharacterised protein [Acinetobacter baumannii]